MRARAARIASHRERRPNAAAVRRRRVHSRAAQCDAVGVCRRSGRAAQSDAVGVCRRSGRAAQSDAVGVCRRSGRAAQKLARSSDVQRIVDAYRGGMNLFPLQARCTRKSRARDRPAELVRLCGRVERFVADSISFKGVGDQPVVSRVAELRLRQGLRTQFACLLRAPRQQHTTAASDCFAMRANSHRCGGIVKLRRSRLVTK